MEFYKIWKTRDGLIGVNKMTLGGLIGANILSILLYFIILAFGVIIVPTILFVLYVLWIINADGGEGNDGRATEQRLWVNVLTLIASIFFMLDFHFGLVAFSIVGGAMSLEAYDSVAIYNLTLGLVSIILFFLGHDLYKSSSTKSVRVLCILIVIFFSYKYMNSVSTHIVKNVITQCDTNESINQDRAEELEKEQMEIKHEEYLRKKEERLKNH